jgi:hypothetical protein
VIRNAVLHLLNEQPLLADLPTPPAPGDVALICTNLRTKDGKRPFFADSSASTFVFPLTQMRFVEIPAAVTTRPEAADADSDDVPTGAAMPALPAAVPAHGPPVEVEDLELDEELLRRVREL